MESKEVKYTEAGRTVVIRGEEAGKIEGVGQGVQGGSCTGAESLEIQCAARWLYRVPY